MGRQLYTVRATGALVAATTKSAFFLSPASTNIFTVTEIGFSIDSSTAAKGVGVELYGITSLGTPVGTAFTPVLVKRSTGLAAATGAKVNLTTEPTHG